MLDLKNLPAQYIEKYGREKVAAVVGREPKLLSMWEKTGAWPIQAVQDLLAFDPAPIHAIKPLYENPPTGTKLCILMPLIGPPEPKSVDCLMRLYDKTQMGFQRMAFNNLSVARNSLAAWGLRNGFEWFYWHDGDMMTPCGDAEWFKREAGLPLVPDVYAGVNTIFRLLSHYLKRGKTDATMVSVCYVTRNAQATPQFGGDEKINRQELRQGPRDMIKQVPWCGFGGVLTHRSVFESIIATQGDELRVNGIGKRFGYEHSFFHPLDRETCGDDLPMCHRAIKAGHKIHVDFALQAAHVGDRPFTFQDC